jgi:hypothetical protein
MGERPSVEVWNDFLFFEIQQANKNNKPRKVIKQGMTISAVMSSVADELGGKIYAVIPVGLTNINDVIVYERPF